MEIRRCSVPNRAIGMIRIPEQKHDSPSARRYRGAVRIVTHLDWQVQFRMSMNRNLALTLILLMGVVSLFGDIVYEGARSVTGPYLLVLGGSALVAATVAGAGEFLGYAVRLGSGYLADRTGSYWFLTIGGYLLVGSIPLLVVAGRWETAALLILLERIGKGIRAPARDAILSHATHQVGRGWGFGIHEALDQIGAILGPLLFTASFLLTGSYQGGFAWTAVPFLLLMIPLFLAWRTVPDPVSLEPVSIVEEDPGIARSLVPYSVFLFFVMAGFLVFPLISFYFKDAALVPDAQIPLFYSIAMGVDALAALGIGRAYDRRGLDVLILLPLLGILIPVLTFSSSYEMALLGTMIWGAAMGIQETVLRAALADFVPLPQRGTAYGILNTVYGASWLVGSLAMGLLYAVSIPALIVFSVTLQGLGFLSFFWMRARLERATRG